MSVIYYLQLISWKIYNKFSKFNKNRDYKKRIFDSLQTLKSNI